MAAQHPPMNSIPTKEIPATGLTVVFDPGQSARLDIAFIHGFTGHPVGTWTHENDLIRPVSTSVYWPRDLLPITIPNGRILTYGYDTNLRHAFSRPLNQATVYDIAGDFLVALGAERRANPTRPILFIAHSLGGIVVKEMLRQASGFQLRHPHLCSVFNSTIGIMFFGTPHGGAELRGFRQHLAEKILRLLGVTANEQIVNTLAPSSERLKQLRDEFGPMAAERNWMVHSFQEGRGINILGGRKVVEDRSSCLGSPPEMTEHIEKNHMDMCRFTGPRDMEYKKVVAVLERTTDTITRRPIPIHTEPLDEGRKKELIEALKFDQMDARQLSVRKAHAETCRWLLKWPEYLNWLDNGLLPQHHGFLWIKGKPGAGKSTLMKFALDNARKTMKDRTIISFFFNARGGSLEKSTAGMYRSLLLQLLQRLPRLQRVFGTLSFAAENVCNDFVQSVEKLKELFEDAVRLLGEAAVVCFIDALDECDDHQVRDMVEFFQEVGKSAVSSGVRFHVLFSSRHYPHISIDKSLELVLEGQEGHGQDITTYIGKQLKIGGSKISEQIRFDLHEKAAGVFMWVVLVVGILNKEYDQGQRGAQLRRKLREIPGDLHKLFHDLLTRDNQKPKELRSCIQWVLFAKVPLKPEELYFAIRSDTEPEDPHQWDQEEIGMDAIQQTILNSSKGLAEITRSKIPTVQFIHESLRDFLLKERGLQVVWPDMGDNFEGESHGWLARCCIRWINSRAVKSLDTAINPGHAAEEVNRLREKAKTAFPFLQYSVQSVLYHADKAEAGRFSQQTLIQDFPLAHWLGLHNLFEDRQIRRHYPTATLLYILAELGLAALIRAHPYSHCCFNPEKKERYGPPIFAALALRNFEAATALLEGHIEVQLPEHILCGFQNLYEEISSKDVLSRTFKFSNQKGVLGAMAQLKIESLLAIYLLTPSSHLELQNSALGGKVLIWAARNRHVAVVELLLGTGQVDIDSKDSSGRTPLSWAAGNGHVAVVELLLGTGQVDIDSKDMVYGQTPLSWAAEDGHVAVVELLLGTGQVDIDSKDMVYGQTPLSWAAGNGHVAVVELLLGTGQVDIDSKDTVYGQTPLSWAAGNGHVAVVEL
ncbi:hypothetical protein B0T16DRAFT_347215, partial [Cercophora newfieldiana]